MLSCDTAHATLQFRTRVTSLANHQGLSGAMLLAALRVLLQSP